MIARLIALLLLLFPAAAQPQSREEILTAMRRATTFMVERVATNGGYVWAYLPDMSRRWGEIEAYPSMVWVQPPGTATMGHLFLDAYHATDDEYYYRAAQAATDALVRGQHRSGGWNYFIDFAGPRSTRQWYQTIGRNAWRMEEFHHYADNATFDDAGTAEAMQLLLRMYLERRDRRYRAPLNRAIDYGITYVPTPRDGLELHDLGSFRMIPCARPDAFRKAQFQEIPFAVPITMVGPNALGVHSLDAWPATVPRRVGQQFELLESALEACRRGLAAVHVPEFIAREQGFVRVSAPKGYVRVPALNLDYIVPSDRGSESAGDAT